VAALNLYGIGNWIRAVALESRDVQAVFSARGLWNGINDPRM
jgi:hypothetical protein